MQNAEYQFFYDNTIPSDVSDICKHRFIPASKAIDEHLAGYLSLQEVTLLRFVLNRTLKWGKSDEKIKIKHFTDGVRVTNPKKEDFGRLLQGPTGLGRTTVMKYLDMLVEKELLDKDRPTEKTAEGIRAFAADQIKLEQRLNDLFD